MSELILSIWKGPLRVRRGAGPTLRRIAEEVSAEYNIPTDAIFLWSRVRRVVYPRQDFMWRCRQVMNIDGSHKFSLPRIAEFLGGMDHTTVLHGARAHEKRLIHQRVIHTKQKQVDDSTLHTAPALGQGVS